MSFAARGVILRRLSAVVLLVALDLGSKSAVFAWLGRLGARGELVPHRCGLGVHERLPLVGDWLAFSLSRNPGAAFGGLAGVPWLLVGGRILAALVLLWLLVRARESRPWTSRACVLILGGALGNLYDNLFLHVPGDSHPFGLVRDFIDVYFGFADWHFDTFNFADSCICVGAVILVATGLFARPPKAEPANS
jgi:signal peptidase II